MAIDYTWSALVAQVRRRALVGGSGTSDWTNDQIVAILNEETQDYIVPLVSTIGEEYFVAIEDFTTVANLAEYDIPTDSIASRVRDVQGLIGPQNQYVSMQRIEPERAVVFGPITQTGQPLAYYVQANQIVFSPTPDTEYSVRLKYYARPRQLVTTGYSAGVSITDTPTGYYTVTVGSTSGMTTGYFDLISPTTYKVDLPSVFGVVASSTTLQFQLSTLTDAEAAYILANFTDIFIASGDSPSATPDLPVEIVPVLTQRVASVLLQAMRDPGAAQAIAECDKALARARHMLAPRTAGLTRKVVNPYGVGWNGPWVGRRGWGQS